MKEVIIYTTYKDGSFITNGQNHFNFGTSVLWQKAGHPILLSDPCLHLDEFKTDANLRTGNLVTEIHNFAGIKQSYMGEIKEVVPGKKWSMHTHPTSLTWLLGLPHGVSYSFVEADKGNLESKLEVECVYKPEGIFKLPLIKSFIKREMEKTIRILLESPTRIQKA